MGRVLFDLPLFEQCTGPGEKLDSTETGIWILDWNRPTL